MENTDTQQITAEEIVENISERQAIKSGKFTKVIDGKTYIMPHDGGNYSYVAPYPSFVDSSCHSRPIPNAKKSDDSSTDEETSTLTK